MFKERVRTPGDALVYLTDCTLATVADLASKKSRGASEFNRQKRIAQDAVDWIKRFGIDPAGTRADDVLNKFAGSVADWAWQYDVRAKK